MRVEVTITHDGGTITVERSESGYRTLTDRGTGRDLKRASELLVDISREIDAVSRHHLPPEVVAR